MPEQDAEDEPDEHEQVVPTVDEELPFSACPSNLRGLPSMRSGWSGGRLLALVDAVADVIPMGTCNRP